MKQEQNNQQNDTVEIGVMVSNLNAMHAHAMSMMAKNEMPQEAFDSMTNSKGQIESILKNTKYKTKI